MYAPVAPTDECVRLLRELEEKYGEVAYIVLPTVAVEHKYFVGPFSQAFPRAQAGREFLAIFHAAALVTSMWLQQYVLE